MMLETGKQCTHNFVQSPLPSSSFEREPNRSLNFRSLGTVLSIIKPNTISRENIQKCLKCRLSD